VSARTPDEILAELGERLDRAARADAAGIARPVRAGRLIVAVVACLAALGGTAAATKSIWAPDAPSLDPHGPTVRVAQTSLGGTPVELDARSCARGRVSVVLRVMDAGAASACMRPGSAGGVFVDASSGRAFAFGTTPHAAVAVASVGANGVATRGVLIRPEPDVVRRAGLPPDVAYYAVALAPEAPTLRAVRFRCAEKTPCAR
jgi:hypothetical protein